MGSPLAHTLANYFMNSLERKNFQNSIIMSPNYMFALYRWRFCCFSNDNARSRFLEMLNSQHTNIKFYCEIGSYSLSFLDVKIIVNDQGNDSFLWHKGASIGILLNFDAFCLSTYISGLILCLLHHAKMVFFTNSSF